MKIQHLHKQADMQCSSIHKATKNYPSLDIIGYWKTDKNRNLHQTQFRMD